MPNTRPDWISGPPLYHDIQVCHEQSASWGFNSYFTESFQVSLLVNMNLLGLNSRFSQCCGSPILTGSGSAIEKKFIGTG